VTVDTPPISMPLWMVCGIQIKQIDPVLSLTHPGKNIIKNTIVTAMHGVFSLYSSL